MRRGLELIGVRARAGGFVVEADLTLPPVGVTAVFGPSGAGKSTLLQVIAGLKKIEGGRVVLDNRVLEDRTESRGRVAAFERDVGLVFQDARLFPHLTVMGNIAYAARRVPAYRRAPDFEALVERLEISHLVERPVRNLSGGEKSRVALARALMAAPNLLLLDEPFAALDGKLRRSFVAMLREVAVSMEMPMMIVTHQIDDAVELADNVVGMRDGRVVVHGNAGEVVGADAFGELLDSRDCGVRLTRGDLRGRDTAGADGDALDGGQGVWVRADNVLLASEEPQGLSARNVWGGRVAGMVEEPSGSVLVRLDTEVGEIKSRVTAEAVAALGVREGMDAWAVVKTHAV